MSTGKRLAKRSIIGTRVVAPMEDGKYYSGVIYAVKTPPTFPENNNCINLTPNTRYSVRFDLGSKGAIATMGIGGKRPSREYAAHELVGPGFRGTAGLLLAAGQRVFLTFNGREVSGEVRAHEPDQDEVLVLINPQGAEVSHAHCLLYYSVSFIATSSSPLLNGVMPLRTPSRSSPSESGFFIKRESLLSYFMSRFTTPTLFHQTTRH